MERSSAVRVESNGMNSKSKKRGNLRVVNPKESSEEKIPWKIIAITSALTAVIGYGAVELLKLGIGKAKNVANGGKASENQPPNPQLSPDTGMPMMSSFPVQPQNGMFQSPYSQMAAMRAGVVPSQFTNPMMSEEDDEPPKWFRQFKEQHDARLAALEASAQRRDDEPSAEDLDDYE